MDTIVRTLPFDLLCESLEFLLVYRLLLVKCEQSRQGDVAITLDLPGRGIRHPEVRGLFRDDVEPDVVFLEGNPVLRAS